MNFNSQGQWKVDFTVDRKGNLGNCYISGSVECSLDEEALRITYKKGRWKKSSYDPFGNNIYPVNGGKIISPFNKARP